MGNQAPCNTIAYEGMDMKEAQLLQNVFVGLASRSPGQTMDKKTFLDYVEFHGMFGERLFDAFDTKKNKLIDLEEFMTGIARFLNGSDKMKIQLLFRMFDLHSNDQITLEELRTMMYSMLTHKKIYQSVSRQASQISQGGSELNSQLWADHIASLKRGGKPLSEISSLKDLKAQDTPKRYHHGAGSFPAPRLSTTTATAATASTATATASATATATTATTTTGTETAASGAEGPKDDEAKEEEKKKKKKKTIVVYSTPSKARPPADLSSSSAAERKKSTRKLLVDVAAANGAPAPECVERGGGGEGDHKDSGVNSPGKPKEFVEAEKVDDFIKHAHDSPMDAETVVAENLIEHTLVNFAKGKDYLTFKEFQDWIEATPQILQFMELNLRAHLFKKSQKPRAGYLRKRGRTFGSMVTRYCVVQDGFLYQFQTDKQAQNQTPTNAIFLRGLRIIEPSGKEELTSHGILFESDVGSRIWYARTAKEKKEWVQWLKIETKDEKLEDEYEIKENVGKGRFAEVYRCIHKKTKRDYAVKVIDKTQIDDADKEGLRAEIAILRLSSHPFIVSMKKVYETKKSIYIIMEWLKHGDLFKAIVKARRFSEDVARHVIQQLCSAIRYCHLRGIVHKDIKPENILVEKLDPPYIRIYVTDFGLSQFAKPAEEMKDAAGSVAYMAPEMIDSDTFTKSVDVWSIGVITYVLLSGCLPFFDKDEVKLMDRIVDDPVEFKQEAWKSVSKEAQDFITKLLQKKPKNRMNITQAMTHPWLQQVESLIPLVRKKTLEREASNSNVGGLKTSNP